MNGINWREITENSLEKLLNSSVLQCFSAALLASLQRYVITLVMVLPDFWNNLLSFIHKINVFTWNLHKLMYYHFTVGSTSPYCSHKTIPTLQDGRGRITTYYTVKTLSWPGRNWIWCYHANQVLTVFSKRGMSKSGECHGDYPGFLMFCFCFLFFWVFLSFFRHLVNL